MVVAGPSQPDPSLVVTDKIVKSKIMEVQGRVAVQNNIRAEAAAKASAKSKAKGKSKSKKTSGYPRSTLFPTGSVEEVTMLWSQADNDGPGTPETFMKEILEDANNIDPSTQQEIKGMLNKAKDMVEGQKGEDLVKQIQFLEKQLECQKVALAIAYQDKAKGSSDVEIVEEDDPEKEADAALKSQG